MKSSLRLVLAEEISDEIEAMVLDKLRQKMQGACSMVVSIVRAMEGRFGKEQVHEVARAALQAARRRPTEEVGDPADDLAGYTENLERGTAGTHEWKRVRDEPNAVGYEFTRCMWAEAFRDLEAADIGSWICEGDDPSVRAYNPQLRCTLTRTLMRGDDCCDHVFHVADGSA